MNTDCQYCCHSCYNYDDGGFICSCKTSQHYGEYVDYNHGCQRFNEGEITYSITKEIYNLLKNNSTYGNLAYEYSENTKIKKKMARTSAY